MNKLKDQPTNQTRMNATLKPIGGFFELELPAKGTLYHDSALALANGRVCLKVLLERVKPAKVYLPFYCCDSVVLPMRQKGIAYEFYAINAAFDPVGIPLLADNELFLYINYFGLKSRTARKLAQLLGEQLILDNSQAFFEESYGATWSFNSVRKFFGVPDGAFLYSPQYLEDKFAPNAPFFIDHLWLRLRGKQEEAFRYYQQSEAMQTLETNGMSQISKQILYSVDFSAVARARKKHYRQLDRALRHLNKMPHALIEPSPSVVPYCYPFLLSQPISKAQFYENGIFLMTLWEDVLNRHTEGYHFEKMLSHNLLPLPIDHRLDQQDLQRIIDAVIRLTNTHAVG
jgi:hypothetical protein